MRIVRIPVKVVDLAGGDKDGRMIALLQLLEFSVGNIRILGAVGTEERSGKLLTAAKAVV